MHRRPPNAVASTFTGPHAPVPGIPIATFPCGLVRQSQIASQPASTNPPVPFWITCDFPFGAVTGWASDFTYDILDGYAILITPDDLSTPFWCFGLLEQEVNVGTDFYRRVLLIPQSVVPGLNPMLAGGIPPLGKISVSGSIALSPTLDGGIVLGKIAVAAGLAVNSPLVMSAGIILGKIASAGGLGVVPPNYTMAGGISLGKIAVSGSLSVQGNVALAGTIGLGKLVVAASLDNASTGGTVFWYFADDTFTAAATTTYDVYCIGSGGAGGGGFLAAGPSGFAGGGGGGGACAWDTVSLTASDVVPITCGTSASPGPAEFGAMVGADLGAPGQDGTAIAIGPGGQGGLIVNSFGANLFSGGAGGDAFSTLGGGGGGSASDNQNGNNGNPGTLVGGIGATGVGGTVFGGQGGGDGALSGGTGHDAPFGSPASWGGGGGGGGGQAFSAGGAAGGGVVMIIQN